MFNRLKDLFYLTRNEKRGLWTVSVLSLLFFGWGIYKKHFNKPTGIFSEMQIAQFQYLATQFHQTGSIEKVQSGGTGQQPARTLRPFRFNPNTISLAALDSMGFPEYPAQNLVNYRKHGGHFDEVNDVAKIYGITDSVFKKIRPFIELPEPGRSTEPQTGDKPDEPGTETRKFFLDPNQVTESELKSFGFDGFVANNIVQYREHGGVFRSLDDLLGIYDADSAFIVQNSGWFRFGGTQPIPTIELNTANEKTLKMLPGIGDFYAEQIVEYRGELGGFVKLGQLNEVYLMDTFDIETIRPHVTINAANVQKLNPEELPFDSLLSHPYFDFYHVKKLYNMAEDTTLTKALVTSNRMLEPEQVERFLPYLEFEE